MLKHKLYVEMQYVLILIQGEFIMGNKTEREAKLIQPEEHFSCKYYQSDYMSKFRYYELSSSESFPLLNTDDNHILFIKEGRICVDVEIFKGRQFEYGDIILLPSFVHNKITILENTKILISSFDVPIESCDKLMIERSSNLIEPENYNFTSIKMKDTVETFVDLLIIYLSDKINCAHLHEIKQKEMFFIFKWYYTEQERASLFHNLSVGSYQFKRTILANYQNAANTIKMAELLNMSRRKFEMTFREKFGDTYANWMLKHISNKIAYKAVEPGVTINDLMTVGNFSSPCVLNRFCQKYFGCTPKKLIDNKGAVKQ